VGAGPGDPKAHHGARAGIDPAADSIIYDYLANDALLASARPDAELIYVGKQASRHEMPQRGINALIAEKARRKRHRGAP